MLVFLIVSCISERNQAGYYVVLRYNKDQCKMCNGVLGYCHIFFVVEDANTHQAPLLQNHLSVTRLLEAVQHDPLRKLSTREAETVQHEEVLLSIYCYQLSHNTMLVCFFFIFHKILEKSLNVHKKCIYNLQKFQNQIQKAP